MRALPVALGVLVYASAAAAQERSLTRFDLPRDVQRRLSVIMDDPATRSFSGAAVIPVGESVIANVVAFDGPLTVAGRVEGELVVLGGSVEFQAGSQVTGDVTVVGGEARGVELASIGGTITTYSEGFELYHRGERILAVNTRSRRGRARRDDWDSWGRSSFVVRTATNYNRVEGLPVMFGPVIETGGTSPTRVEALGILRTEGGDLFDTRHMGYVLRAEQFLGGRWFRIGGSAHSFVDPIESWNLTRLEASLATFLLHEDQRDYFEREGWGAYARLSPRSFPLDMTVGYWDEDHGSRAARSPWTLFGDGGWRAQPLIGEGRLRSLAGRLEYDGRDDNDFATSGVFIHAEATHGLEGTLRVPSRVVFGSDPASFNPAVELNQRFNHGLLDVRLYRRVGIDATLALRGVAGGSLDGEAIPPQFQHALGGAGTLPGYSLFRADCGARQQLVRRETDSQQSYFPHYGCDRFAMGSIEYRGGFDFDFGGDWDFWGHGDEDWDWHIDASPNWMVFFNAGQGWALDESRALGARNTEVLYDAGAGLMLGDFGVFGAVPLNGANRGVNFFVRLGARF